MKEAQFVTQWRKDKKCEGRKFIQQSKTETLGHMTIKQKIENFKNAGLVLKAAREGSYDIAPNSTEQDTSREKLKGLPTTPTRDRGFDFSDAKRLEKYLQDRQKHTEKKVKQKQEELLTEAQKAAEAAEAATKAQKDLNQKNTD